MRPVQATTYPTRALAQGSPTILFLLAELATSTAVRVLPRLGDRN